MSAVAPFATKNGALSKRQERPAQAIACAHGKKVLAYEAKQRLGIGKTMRRREFIGLVAGAAGALTCADVFAAQKSPKARIGYLEQGPTPFACCADAECKSPRRDAYQNPTCWLPYDLNALGWREGENLQIEIRSSQDGLASLPRLAAELVALRPDILIAVGSDETKALSGGYERHSDRVHRFF
jgi:hypothetical protein